MSRAEGVRLHAVDGDEGAQLRFMHEMGWTDGLPVVQPTLEHVHAMLGSVPRGDWEADVGVVPPRGGRASRVAVAVNAVLAGLPDSLFPYLVAAVRAACRPEFNLPALQTTTNPVGAMVVVGGPSRREAGFADGTGALGPGCVANATLGRALRLCLQNLGGASASTTDRATLGQPGKYTFCLAENEDANPWTPLRMQVGGCPGDAVTLIPASGTVSLNVKWTHARELIGMIADSLRIVASNDYLFGGWPLVVFSPEHAGALASEGWSMAAVQEFLAERTAVPFSSFASQSAEQLRRARSAELGPLRPDTPIRQVKLPEDFLVCISGGAGYHTTFIPTFGDAEPVSEPVDVHGAQP